VARRSGDARTLHRGVLGLAVLLALLGLTFWSASAQDGNAPDAGYNLLTNDHLTAYDPTYGHWYPWNACEVDEQVAAGWHRFNSGAVAPAWLWSEVYAFHSCMGDGVWEECIGGQPLDCQFIAGLNPYDAGIYQRVTGLTPGIAYGFHTVMLTIYESAGEPRVDGKMFKQIGMDPTGGIDPLAPTVVWTEPNGTDKAWDLQQRTSVLAEGSAVTVFARVTSTDRAYHWQQVNLSILDSAILAKTPTVSATSPSSCSTTAFWVSWDNVLLAPGAKYFRGCDVQWMDEAVGIWHDWFTQTMQEGATFTGQYSHTYRFRARAWQQYENDAWLYGPYSATYDSRTQVYWGRLTGHVVSPEGQPLWGAELRVGETEQKAWTGWDGRYLINLLPGHTELTLSVSKPGWLSPANAHGIDVAQGQTAIVDWVLRPPDDAVVNGEFEEGLEGWQLLADAGVTPEVVAYPVHTGLAALELGGEAVPSHTVAVSQTLSLSNAWEPVLSFLYRPAETDEGDLFAVELTLVQEITPSQAVTTTWTVIPSLDVDGWTHFWTQVGPEGTSVTGTLSAQFRVYDDGGEETVVHLDEVSFGATPGGPYRIYLPTIPKDH